MSRSLPVKLGVGSLTLLLLLTPVFTVAGCDTADTETEMREEIRVSHVESSDVVGDAQPIQSWKLPKQLHEISGLAADGSGRVYAVADEQAHVFLLDPLSGATVSVFGLGRPVVKGDFEGIALHADWLYLITADGTLLRTVLQNVGGRSGAQLDGSTLGYEAFALNTGCLEIEGLATSPDRPWLWLVCKVIKPVSGASSASSDVASAEAVIRLEAWSTETQALLPTATLELPLAEVLAQTGQKKFSPSGLAFVPAFTNEDTVSAWDLLVISGAQRAYSRFSWSGDSEQDNAPRFLSAGRLNSRHRQAEGIEVGSVGSLLVADEGAGKRARLRVYPKGAFP